MGKPVHNGKKEENGKNDPETSAGKMLVVAGETTVVGILLGIVTVGTARGAGITGAAVTVGIIGTAGTGAGGT